MRATGSQSSLSTTPTWPRRFAETDERVRGLRSLCERGDVLPPPVQDRIPIWLGYTGPKGARRAGRLGEGLLVANPDLCAPYRKGLIEGGHNPAAARMAGLIGGFITDEPDADWPVVARHLAYQWDSYRRHMVEGTGHPAPKPIDPDEWRARGIGPGFDRFLFATPKEAAKAIHGFLGGTPTETVFFWASLAGISEDMVARHIETICTRRAPLLRAPEVPDTHDGAAESVVVPGSSKARRPDE